MIDPPFACDRQAADDICRRCGTDSMQDLRSRRARDLLGDADARYRRARTERMTASGAVAAVATFVLLWFVPGVSALFDALPQRWAMRLVVAAAIGAGLAVIALLDRASPRRRFGYLDELPPADRA